MTWRDLRNDLVVLACAVSAGIHGALAPAHFEERQGRGAGFVVAAVLLAVLAVELTRRPGSRSALAAAVAVFVGLLASYGLAVTTGVPLLHPEAEPVEGLALATKAIEVARPPRGLEPAAAARRRPQPVAADPASADRPRRLLQRARRARGVERRPPHAHAHGRHDHAPARAAMTTWHATGATWRSPDGSRATRSCRAAPLDPESREWLRALRARGREHDEAVARLHGLLLRAARFETARRRPALPHLRGNDLDDIAAQAADDALVSVLRRLDSFRGASRFTTWAYKFALLEAAVKLRRRAWQGREVPLEPETWSLFSSAGLDPDDSAEQSELLETLQRAIAEVLTPHQRRVLVALALNGVPIDVLAERLETTRGALYKTLHDARSEAARSPRGARPSLETPGGAT